jgi:tetratricopeptide (TPR) repeat protein
MIRKLPIAIFISALILGAVAIATNRSTEPDRSATSIDSALVSSTVASPEAQAEFWQRRVDENPDDYLSRTSLGSSLLAVARTTGDLGVYEDAEQVFEAALALNPTYESALLGFGAARAAQHDFQAQLDLATRVYGDNPDNLNAHLTIADARMELGDVDEASRIYDEIALEERSAPLLSRQAKVAWYRGDGTGAVDLSFEAIEASSTLELPAEQAAGYFFQLATYAYGTGEIDTASDAIGRAQSIDSEGLSSLELAPKILIAQGDIDGATAAYEDLVARTPAADLHGELAKLYERAGRAEDARLQVELGLEIGREQVGRYPAERRHLADFFGSYDAALALQLAEEDIETRRDVGAYDTLSWALYQNGRYDEAREASRQALAGGIQDVDVLFHAGMAEAAIGNTESARDLLTRALDINPRFDLDSVDEARRVLDSLE